MVIGVFLHLETDIHNSNIVQYLNQITDPINLYITHCNNESVKEFNRFTPAILKIPDGGDLAAFLRCVDYWQKNGIEEELIFKIQSPNRHFDHYSPEYLLKTALESIVNKWDKVTTAFKHDEKLGFVGVGELYRNDVIGYEEIINDYFERFGLSKRLTGHFMSDIFLARTKVLDNFFKQNNPIKILSDFEGDQIKIDAFRKIWYGIFKNEGFEVRNARSI